jgi:hypothetical protein
MDTVTVRLRNVMLLLAALVVMASAAELVLIEHWGTPAQTAPWVTLGVVVVAGGLVALVPTRRVLLGARVAAGLSVVSAGWGLVEHVLANRAFASELHPGWSEPSLLWAGISGNLPALAPLAVAFPAMLVAGATLGHPALHATHPAAAGAHPDDRRHAMSVTP